MSDQSRPVPAAHARTKPAREVSGRVTTRRAVTASAVVLTIAAAAGVTNFLAGGPDPANGQTATATDDGADTGATGQGDSCPLDGGTLTVAAAPDIAAVIRAASSNVVDSAAGALSLCSISVEALDPADFVSSWGADAAARPDVWVPDSSFWVFEAAAADVQVPAQTESVASSPVVLALSTEAAGRLTSDTATLDIGQVLDSRASDTPTRVGLPDPRRSATAAGLLIDVRATVTGRSDARAALIWALRSSPTDLPVESAELLARLADDPDTAVPVSEQAVWQHNSAGADNAVAVYPSADGSHLDYPYVVLTTDEETAAVANGLLATLQAAGGRQLLQASGFRDADGRAGAAMTTEERIDAATRAPSEVAPLDVVEDAIRMAELSNQPSRLLALLDVSASMRAIVPDSDGATRLNLAKDAAARGLGLYPDDSELGLWTFSTNLTATTDYHELVPVGPLTPSADGTTGHERIAAALATTQVKPFGGTGLYDTVLEAVRRMRAEWDPTRVNSVILLSDGQNDDKNSVSLTDLLTTLANEHDPNRPVPVIAIAFGPDSDVAAMTQISTATEGATYVAEDPREIGEIFLDAIGQRLCRPEC